MGFLFSKKEAGKWYKKLHDKVFSLNYINSQFKILLQKLWLFYSRFSKENPCCWLKIIFQRFRGIERRGQPQHTWVEGWRDEVSVLSRLFLSLNSQKTKKQTVYMIAKYWTYYGFGVAVDGILISPYREVAVALILQLGIGHIGGVDVLVVGHYPSFGISISMSLFTIVLCLLSFTYSCIARHSSWDVILWLRRRRALPHTHTRSMHIGNYWHRCRCCYCWLLLLLLLLILVLADVRLLILDTT